MSLSVRIFLVYLIFISLSSYFVLNTVMDEIRPGVRQSTEETLVDTANLLAEILREPIKNGNLQNSNFPKIFSAYGQRKLQAKIWGIEKVSPNHRIYVTDTNGVVVLDSANIAVGQNYMHWNDVYLTLQGKYGARSTPEVFDGQTSSVMYVAAPIIDNEKIIGVVSVAKPNRTLQPFIDRSKQRLLIIAGVIVSIGLLAGILFSWWLTLELRRLREYALAVSAGKRAVIPQSKIASGELRQLAQSLESMRIELDGKAYIERYIQTLAHELKSPLAAIRASTELLQSPELEAVENQSQRSRFIQNIDNESFRLQQIIEQLLTLALVEQQQSLQDPKPINIKSVLSDLIESQAARILQNNFIVDNAVPDNIYVEGERFLLQQAFANLMENAFDFTAVGGRISIGAEQDNDAVKIIISNEGEQIPDYALNRLTERFYSLPRPRTGKKSTGLGLNFVNEVMALHGGTLEISNIPNGVSVTLIFPSQL